MPIDRQRLLGQGVTTPPTVIARIKPGTKQIMADDPDAGPTRHEPAHCQAHRGFDPDCEGCAIEAGKTLDHIRAKGWELL